MPPIVPVVLSGGSGTRLWPASRRCYPKQFLALVGPQSLLQTTLGRFAGEAGFAAPVVVASESHRFIVAAQAQECGVELGGLLVEPLARDTAPAVAAAAAAIMARDPEALMLIMPADHVIARPDRLRQAVHAGAPAAADGWLVTFGIRPESPETGYGYIAMGDEPVVEGVWRAAAFTEKPDIETARSYVAGGAHLWNSGLLLARAATLLAELDFHAPDIADAARAAVSGAAADLDFLRLAKAPLDACRKISLDYALLQDSSAVAVVPVDDLGWSDIGSWDMVHAASEQDRDGNSVRGEAILSESRETLCLMTDDRLFVGLGLKNLAVVSTPDALLVADRAHAQGVKAIVDQLNRDRPALVSDNRRAYRPWGHYETLDGEDGYRVRRITLKPGSGIALQRHLHRAEHWIVVSGTARVSRDGETFEVVENASIEIPAGSSHGLHNPGGKPLVIVEVQSGSLLNDSDVERFETEAGRA